MRSTFASWRHFHVFLSDHIIHDDTFNILNPPQARSLPQERDAL
jgi:hypothetical protein